MALGRRWLRRSLEQGLRAAREKLDRLRAALSTPEIEDPEAFARRAAAAGSAGRHEEALSLYHELLEGTSPERTAYHWAAWLGVIAQLRKLDRLEESLFAADGAVHASKAAKPYHRAVLFAERASTLHSLGRDAEALGAFDEAMALFEAAGRTSDAMVAFALEVRARVFERLGRPEDCLSDIERAATLFEEDGQPGEAARVLLRLAVHQRERRAWSPALACAEQALELFGQIDDHGGAAQALRMTAILHEDTGDVESAIAAFGRAEEAYRRAGEVARATEVGLARTALLSRAGRQSMSAEVVKALSASTAGGGNLGGLLGVTLHAAGDLAKKGPEGREAALRLLDEAFAMFGDVMSLEDAVLLDALRAGILAREGLVEEANRIVADIESRLPPDSPLLRSAVLSVKGSIASMRGDHAGALAADREAAAGIPDGELRAHMSSSIVRQLYLSGQPEEAVRHARRALAAQESRLARNPTPVVRANLSEELLVTAATLVEGLIAKGEIAAAVSAMEARRAWTFGGGWPGGDAPPEGPRAEPSIEEIERTCARIAASAARSPEGTILLCWYPSVLEERLSCLVIAPGASPVFLRWPAGSARVSAAISRVINDAMKRRTDLGALDEIGETVLSSPVEVLELDGASAPGAPPTLGDLLAQHRGATLGIVPLMNMQVVPFAALPRTVAANRRYLIEDHPIFLSPSLPLLARPSAPRPGSRRAVLLADPDGSLPSARRECDAVGAVLSRGGFRARRLDALGDVGLDAAEFCRSLRGAEIIHVSTHGSYDPENPFHSCLLLGRDADDAPRVVTVEQILRTDLTGASAFLSACETATPDPRRFFDSVSIAAAFLHAGCSRVVAGLWPVHSLPTTLLAEHVYTNVFDVGLDFAEAVRAAQLGMLYGEIDLAAARRRLSFRESRSLDLRLPFFWAPYCCNGRP